MRGLRFLGASVVLALLAASPLPAQSPAREKQFNIDSFETVWTTIRDKHWDKNPGGLDWLATHAEFRPKIEAAATIDETRAVIREMLSRLHQTHFAIVASDIYDNVAAEGGEAWPGFEVRVLEGAVLVSSLSPETPGVNPGWEVLSVDGIDLRELVRKLHQNPGIQEAAIQRAVLVQMRGPTGKRRRFEFRTSAEESAPPVIREIALLPPRGNATTFGNLPTQYVWFESRKIGNTGYVAFNEFLDLVRVMGQFGSAVQSCGKCDGLIIDLRGNPGGIGGMAMGMAGWLVDRQNLRLGTMYMRGATLNFVINPRADAYLGPVAILVDGASASTSEIFAGGLKDIGRARVFGTRTAAAALPSVFMRLPNGDGFQYAIANYISQGGKALEGIGVTPDEEVKLSREGLLAGHDAVLDAAFEWIRQQRGK
ncbi:MAG: S41 family peptidase [Bryobacteraceae bacterium]